MPNQQSERRLGDRRSHQERRDEVRCADDLGDRRRQSRRRADRTMPAYG